MSNMLMNRFPNDSPWSSAGFFVGDKQGLSSEEALKKADIDWTVSKRSIYYDGTNMSLVKDPKFVAIVRDTDNKRLGIAKRSYEPIQNMEAFKFLDGLAKNNSIQYHSVGTFQDGKKVWALAKISESEILPDDMLDHYILIYNSHDGSSALTATLTSIRIACTNAILGMLRDSKKIGINIRHTKNAHQYLDDARTLLIEAKTQSEHVAALAKHMTKIKISNSNFKKIAYNLFPEPQIVTKQISDRASKNAEARRNTLFDLFIKGQGQDISGVVNTGWAALNAVTEYTNHYKPVRGNSATKRLENLVLNPNNKLVTKATNLILQAA